MNGWNYRCKRSKCRDFPFPRWYSHCPTCGRKRKGLTPEQKYGKIKSDRGSNRPTPQDKIGVLVR